MGSELKLGVVGLRNIGQGHIVLRGRESLSSTPERGLEVMRIIEAIFESGETGESVQF